VQQTRREFVKTSGLATAALGAPALLSAQHRGDKIRMGFIGVGNRGSQLLSRFMQNKDVQVAALCDVYDPYLRRNRAGVDPRIIKSIGSRVPGMGETFADTPAYYDDFRRVLDDKDIDAVCIATPDHWHAVQTTWACQAGKDVYVEKPLTATIKEGRRMVEVAAQTKRIVEVGLNRRGSLVYQHLAGKIQHGAIGRVSVALAGRVSNMFPDGIGKMQPTEPPQGLDWDMWLGPRMKRPFQFNIMPYKFRWWSDFSSQVGNWGVHYMDAIRWLLDEQAPVAVSAFGSRTILDDDSDIPDTLEVLFEFASGGIIKFSINEACSGAVIPGGEVALKGTKANVIAGEKGYRIEPARPGQFQTWEKAGETAETRLADLTGGDARQNDSTSRLIRNFLDCVKSRKEPWCPLEQGHRSTSFAHLANIALARRQRLQWDAEKERFINDEQANAMLDYEHRAPWTLA